MTTWFPYCFENIFIQSSFVVSIPTYKKYKLSITEEYKMFYVKWHKWALHSNFRMGGPKGEKGPIEEGGLARDLQQNQ